MLLKGERLVIRRPEPADAEPSFRWFSDPEVTRYLPLAGKGHLPLESIKAFLANAALSDRPELAVTIQTLDGTPIGCGGFRAIIENESAELSIVLGERSLHRSGLGSEALDLMLAYAFGEMRLATVWLIVRADNNRAVRLFRSRGFEVEETLSAAVIVDDVPWDKWRMVLSASRYSEAKPAVT